MPHDDAEVDPEDAAASAADPSPSDGSHALTRHETRKSLLPLGMCSAGSFQMVSGDLLLGAMEARLLW